VGSDERLDQRVRTLEYELKILKNEIQRTLLDIQEQILTHYYPALRSEQPNPVSGSVRSPEAVQEKRGNGGQAPAGGEVGNAEMSPQARKVTLEDVRKARQEQAGPVEMQPAALQDSKAGQANLVALTGWINSTVPKIGADRASKLLEMFSQKGSLANDAKDVLVKLCGTIGGNPPEAVATNDLLSALLKLDELLGGGTNVEETLSLIDEAKLG